MQYEEIVKLVHEVAQAGLSYFTYDEGNIHISMGVNPQDIENRSSVISDASAEPVKESDKEAPKETIKETGIETESSDNVEKFPKSGNLIRSPLVGVFYAAPEEGGKPYVHVGEHVTKGQVIGVVEAMKLMNEIESEYDGVVSEILVENEAVVGYDQPLIRIEQK